MLKNLKKTTAGTVFVVALVTVISLAGCSTDVSQNTPSSSGQQSTSQPTQQQPSGSSGQQPTGTPGQRQPPDAANMTAVLNRAAEILGVSAEKFTAAFQKAMPTAPSGQQQGQPPAPPSGQQGQPPQAPPSGGQQGQQPPGGGAQLTEAYAKMSAELNISADSIAKAMAQAQQELMKK